jgi:ABC-type Mn2+/Zn2+ transport system permease subunit
LLEPFQLPFVQRGLLEVLILAIPAGLLGTWIVLRGLAFFSHAVGTAAFPGLVLADGLGFAAPLGALGAALAGLWLSVKTDAPPGATIARVAGTVFAAAALGRALAQAPRAAAVAGALGALALLAAGCGNSSDGGDQKLDVVGTTTQFVTTMFGFGVLLALSPASPPGVEALLFGDVLGPSDADLAAAAALAVTVPMRSGCCTAGSWPTASTAARRGRSGSPRPWSTRPCSSCSRPRSSSPSRGSATCWSSPC